MKELAFVQRNETGMLPASVFAGPEGTQNKPAKG
jgi:hypothetical protein